MKDSVAYPDPVKFVALKPDLQTDQNSEPVFFFYLDPRRADLFGIKICMLFYKFIL